MTLTAANHQAPGDVTISPVATELAHTSEPELRAAPANPSVPDISVRNLWKVFGPGADGVPGSDEVAELSPMELKEQTGATMLYVSHDFGVIARMSDRVAVLYRGELVEVDAAAAVLTSPRHPYTRALLESVPRLGRQTLPSALPAEPADSSGIDCSFVSRRPASDNDRQRVAPELVDDREETSDAHIVRCRNVTDISVESTRGGGDGETTMASDMPPLLVVDQVFAHYGRANGRISSWMRMALGRPPAQHAQVLTDVTVTVGEGQTLAIVGESGSGKSTLARVVAGLLRPNRGMIKFDGQALPAAVVKRRPETRRRIQLVFQNPDSSLNPRHTIGQIVARPLTVFDRRRGVDRQRVVEELLQAVGLDLSYLRRFPRQLSGGERQRVAIARAFAAEPSLVLCDEVVSALDVSVQAAVLRLLDQLRRESGVSYVFISHDLAVVRAFADHVAVLYGGVVCELGPVEDVYAPPYHPYTETLLAAVLEPIPGTRPRLLVREEADSTIAPGSVRGCPFHDRCPRKVGSLCELELPPLRRVQGKHFIRCHIEPDSLAQHQENMTERSV